MSAYYLPDQCRQSSASESYTTKYKSEGVNNNLDINNFLHNRVTIHDKTLQYQDSNVVENLKYLKPVVD